MNLSILHRTSEYRGDHAADVAIAILPTEGETVVELAARVFAGNAAQGRDWIEIRIAQEPPKIQF